MMAMLNSEERRLPEFIRLGEAAGLEFVKLWDLGEMGLVEYRFPKAPQSHLQENDLQRKVHRYMQDQVRS